MKCPNCLKELEDQASFCGYCGTKIENQKELNSGRKRKKSKIERKAQSKGGLGVKIFLFFSILAVILGVVAGYVTARDIVDWRGFLPQEDFRWDDFPEAESEEEITTEEDSKEKTTSDYEPDNTTAVSTEENEEDFTQAEE